MSTISLDSRFHFSDMVGEMAKNPSASYILTLRKNWFAEKAFEFEENQFVKLQEEGRDAIANLFNTFLARHNLECTVRAEGDIKVELESGRFFLAGEGEITINPYRVKVINFADLFNEGSRTLDYKGDEVLIIHDLSVSLLKSLKGKNDEEKEAGFDEILKERTPEGYRFKIRHGENFRIEQNLNHPEYISFSARGRGFELVIEDTSLFGRVKKSLCQFGKAIINFLKKFWPF